MKKKDVLQCNTKQKEWQIPGSKREEKTKKVFLKKSTNPHKKQVKHRSIVEQVNRDNKIKGEMMTKKGKR